MGEDLALLVGVGGEGLADGADIDGALGEAGGAAGGGEGGDASAGRSVTPGP